MAKRHSDARLIQQGASNPLAIANAFVDGCREIFAEQGSLIRDPALRLIAHQLAHVMNIREFDETLQAYRDAEKQCEIETGKEV